MAIVNAPYRIPRYTVSLVREKSINSTDYPIFSNSAAIYDRFKDMFNALDREHFMILCLDSKNRIIGLHDIATGSLSSAVVHPREVLKAAILNSAAAIIALHNHPSGDPTPSHEDKETTDRINAACKIMGIRMLDHIVFGEQFYFSFTDDGILT
jgi:DNA repair protein RadC